MRRQEEASACKKTLKAYFLVFGATTVYRRTQNQLIGTEEPTTRERPEEAKVKEKSRMERDKAVQCKRDQAKNDVTHWQNDSIQRKTAQSTQAKESSKNRMCPLG